MATQTVNNKACIFYVESSTLPRQIGGVIFCSKEIADQFAESIRAAGKRIGEYVRLQVPDWDLEEQPVCIFSPTIDQATGDQVFNPAELSTSTGVNMSHEEVVKEWSSEQKKRKNLHVHFDIEQDEDIFHV